MNRSGAMYAWVHLAVPCAVWTVGLGYHGTGSGTVAAPIAIVAVGTAALWCAVIVGDWKKK